MAYYASPFYQNLVSLTEHRLPQVLETTYMDHYTWPYRHTRKLTLQDLKPPIMLPTNQSPDEKVISANSETPSISTQPKKKYKFDNRNWHQDFAPDDPQWKIDGWEAAENFWFRPLIERQEYVKTFGKIWEEKPRCDVNDKSESLCEESNELLKSRSHEEKCVSILRMETDELIEKGYKPEHA